MFHMTLLNGHCNVLMTLQFYFIFFMLYHLFNLVI
uniref:Uncharacterized protein n=1 Tax=Arundo donax TaxID=35708 RepID=A0A0A9F577_ARUDO